MLPTRVGRAALLSCVLLTAACGDDDDGGTGPVQPRERTPAEQLSDRPVAVKNTAIAPQFFDSPLSAPASGEPMTEEEAAAFLQNLSDPQVDVGRALGRVGDAAVQSRVPDPAMRAALAFIAEYSPAVWEQFTTAETESGEPLVGVLEFSRGTGPEWESGSVYARVQASAGSDQLAYIINDLYEAEDPRVIGAIIAHEILTHTSAHNSMHAEAAGVGIQSHLYARIVANNPELLQSPTRLRQIVSQLTIQYMMGTPTMAGASASDQGIRGSNGNQPLVVTSDRLRQRNFVSLFSGLGGDPIPGSAILGQAYQALLGAANACPTETIDASTTACLDGQIGTWSSGEQVLTERVRWADLFTLDLKKRTD
ncbi:MAG TPA: hypothetical protein VF167_10825 [Longimicrobiaceae bacterium]